MFLRTTPDRCWLGRTKGREPYPVERYHLGLSLPPFLRGMDEWKYKLDQNAGWGIIGPKRAVMCAGKLPLTASNLDLDPE